MLETRRQHDCQALNSLALGEITIAGLVTAGLFVGAPLRFVLSAFFAAHVAWIVTVLIGKLSGGAGGSRPLPVRPRPRAGA
ncbi:hypothetical protein [Kineosporia succinea]|uniref:Uncharacterized protein n=1 Tax=Kineosporia succinea TaxID=84632 RepID=A0ABT9NVF6_9ACTN|nr:hypothetical protein [Kineosporia succinea]MDP9824408.1 hypothetical protein [Kineosporia succinea]